MLYQLYETQRALLSPFAEFASATSKLYNHPLSPFAHTPGAQRVSAGLDDLCRVALTALLDHSEVAVRPRRGAQQQQGQEQPPAQLLVLRCCCSTLRAAPDSRGPAGPKPLWNPVDPLA